MYKLYDIIKTKTDKYDVPRGTIGTIVDINNNNNIFCIEFNKSKGYKKFSEVVYDYFFDEIEDFIEE